MKYITGLISIVFALCCGLLTPTVACTAAWAVPQSSAPADAYAYIIQPTDGDTVAPTFTVKFGLSGMGVAPAGVDIDNTGHHHLLIDLDELPALAEPLSATDHIKHFGGGQTETALTLSPGPHTLQLLLGNYIHVPHHQPVLSAPIQITVE